MSLILDAIKKSERARQQQEIPGITANHEDYQAEVSSKRWWLLVTILILILLLMVYLAVFSNYFSFEKTAITKNSLEQNNQVQTEVPEIQPIVEVNKPHSILKQPKQLNSKQESPKPKLTLALPVEKKKEKLPTKPEVIKEVTTPKTVSREDAASISTEGIPRLNEISISLQKKLPILEFSSHVFTGEQATSFVVLNDEMLGVDEQLDDISIVKITKQGLVIELDGEEIFLDALQNWQP